MINQVLNPEDEMSGEQLNQEILILNEKLYKSFKHLENIKQYLTYKKILCSKQLQKIKMESNDLLTRNQKFVQQMQDLHQKQKQVDNERVQLLIKINQKKKDKMKVAEWSVKKLNELNMEMSATIKETKLLETNNEYVVQNTNSFESKLNNINKQFKELQAQYLMTEEEINQYHDLIDQCYLTKKKMNSELQEQRGNIRVYCRIRPFHSNQDDWPICQLLNQNTLKLNVPKENQKTENSLKDHIYNFEQIFNMRQSQQDIFQELCQLIQNAVDGKNVCIFAYGQTGSGKTYTMQGGSSEKSKGIIPRSINLIFSQVKRSQKYKWNFEISVAIQEVYLQGVRDLIEPKKEDNDTISRFIVKSPQELECYIQQASKNRKVAETSCNEHSSRSHLIVTIHIHSRNEDKNLERQGSLNLVDLAGSQRVNSSRVQGDRLKQTQAINKSLTNLGIVISALAKKQQHIPFRNSKLTFLLQKYLEGESKTLMFVNISPKISDFNQTICSLRFAEKVKECKIKKIM